MPLQNRVTPEGKIVAVTARGTMMGNRGGCFHRNDKTLKARHWASKQWICCVLEFKGRRHKVMSPGLYTALFFLDEATAISAGHRPCFECRRADAVRFAGAWAKAKKLDSLPRAPEMDAELHRFRVISDGHVSQWGASTDRLPNGAFIMHLARPHLVMGNQLLPWSHDGYGAPVPRPLGKAARLAQILTPIPMVAVISAGYRPMLHPSAAARLG
jgi:hypothetical protein